MASTILKIDGVERGEDMFKVDPRIVKIRPGHNPRTVFDPDKLASLKASILKNGVREPITIVKDEDAIYLVDGERRHRCVLELIGEGYGDQFLHIKATVQPQTRSKPVDLLLTAMVKNQSDPLVPLDLARGVERFIVDFQWTVEEVADHLGHSANHIRDLLKLLTATPAIQDMLQNGQAKMTEVIQAVRHADRAEVPQEEALQVVRQKNDTIKAARRAITKGFSPVETLTPAPYEVHEATLKNILTTIPRDLALGIIFEIIPKAVVVHFLETGELP